MPLKVKNDPNPLDTRHLLVVKPKLLQFMSNSTTPVQAADLSSTPPDPLDSDQRNLPGDAFSDPLLWNGSFIYTTNNFSASGQTTIKSNGDDYQAASAPTPTPTPTPTPAPQSSNSANGVETETPSVKSRRKVPVTMPPGTVESASWLPPGWLIEDRVRSSGATAGTVDKYYIEPTTGRKLRSKKEVQYYLETGTVKRRKRGAENSEADPFESSGDPNKKAGKNVKGFEMKFDFLNVPDRIEWALTDANKDAWTPFIGGSKVPEYDRQNWEFEMLHSHC